MNNTPKLKKDVTEYIITQNSLVYDIPPVINLQDADEDVLKQVIPISPHEYREENEDEEELNEMRHRAGLDTVNLHGEPDSELKAFISMAGL